jgi:DNA primase small subunit
VTAFSDPLLKFFYGARRGAYGAVPRAHPLARADHLFPYKEMVEWLCYGHHPESKSKLADKTFFKRREISFTLKGDVYARYKSFANKDEFREAIRSKCPYKIDIGAVYNYPPEQRNAVSKFITLSRELVFDIDMTDYALVKSCCSMLCPRCWPLMVCAIKVLDRILRIDLGFKHM